MTIPVLFQFRWFVPEGQLTATRAAHADTDSRGRLSGITRHVAPSEPPGCGRKCLAFLDFNGLTSWRAEYIAFGIPALARSRFAWTVFNGSHCFP
jgi:hypothetical protein